MAEIAALPWNGLTCASLFAGAGGSSLGWRLAGFKMLYANEFVPIAQESYKANASPSTFVDGTDVREVKPHEMLRRCGLGVGELDALDGSPPCFAAGTLILTKRGLLPIENVRSGDVVVTHKGRWRLVRDVTKRKSPTIRVRGHGHPGITTTAEHPFYVRKATLQPKRSLAAPEWRAAGDCAPIKRKTSYFWGMRRTYDACAIPEICRSDARSALVEMSEAVFWLAGLWLGDGWLRTGKVHVGGTRRGEVLICAAKDEAAQVRDRVAASGFRFSEAEMRTTIRFTICHAGLADWLWEDFGRGAAGKTVPYWAFGMPEPWRQAMFDGYVFADGTIPREGAVRTTSISWHLTLGMAMIARSLGKASGIRSHENIRPDHRIEGRRVNAAGMTYA
jgi:hypothetical protein